MKTLNAAEFGVLPEQEITQQLSALFDEAANCKCENIIFSPGTYYINSEKCRRYMLYITNTVGDKEFKNNETPHLNEVPFYLNGIKNLTIEGSGAVFIIEGKVTNSAIENCENIVVRNMEIRHAHPDMHELRVVNKSLFSVDYEIDKDSQYTFENSKLYFYGTGYKCAADLCAANAHWIGLLRSETPEKIKRVSHPLFGAVRIQDISNRRFRAYYPNTMRFKIDDRFYLFDVRRQYAGIFINKSRNIVIDAFKQRFNYSLAFVAQDSENVTIKNSCFAPEKNSARKMASVADFMQVCMCRGKFSVSNSVFDGAGDDCLNVHGIHFKIIKAEGNKITVRFMHPQSHGFNPLRAGDEIAYINTKTMLQEGTSKIQSSELLNETDIQLVLDKASDKGLGYVVEDIDACPDVDFENNYLTRIITRGLLLTTRGRVRIKNNHFKSTTMSGILLSDDAESWYESGMCLDVSVENNKFEYCGETPVRIKPENKIHAAPVHKNIKITGNEFMNYKGFCITAKSTDNLVVSSNKYCNSKHLKTVKCSNVKAE